MLRHNLSECPCANTVCPNHGNCDPCLERHADGPKKVFCDRTPEEQARDRESVLRRMAEKKD